MANTKVTGDVIANGTISTVHIADDAITAAKLDSTATGITFADLAVSGNSTLTGNLTVNGAFTSQGIDDNADATAITISGNEEVGIGTTSPTYKLHVAGTTGITGNLIMSTSAEIRSSDGTGIRLRNAANSANEGGFVRSGLWKGDSSRDPSLFAETGLGLRFYTGGSATERMYIDSSGNVGISSTDVQKQLSIGNAQADGIQFNYDTTNNYRNQILNYWNSNTDTRMDFNIARTGGQTPQTIMSVGYNSNVGIGITSPAAKLHVKGDTGGSDSIVRFQNTNSTAKSTRIQLMDYSGAIGDGLIAYDHSNADSQYHYLGLGINNSTALVVNNNDYVGIGTTSPAEKLTIDGTSSGAYVRISNAGSGDISSGYMIYNGTNLDFNVYTNPLFGNTTLLTREALAIRAGGSERIRITSGGDVGIGRTSPVSILELGDDTPILTISDTGNNYNDGDVQAVVHLSGRWYSGTANPASDNYSDARIVLRKDSGDGTGGSSLAFETSATAAGGLTEAIRIDKSQNLGIGTISPTTKLSVTDGASMYANNNYLVQIKRNAINSNDDTSKASILLANNSNAFQIAYGGTTDRLRFINGSGTEQMTLLNGGNVGIGLLNPSVPLHVYSAAPPGGVGFKTQSGNASNWIQNTTTAGSWQMGVTSSGWQLYNDDTSSIRVTVQNGGNVGIGTTSPAEKLDLGYTGSIRVGNMKFEPANGGRIGFNRNTSNGAIYDSNYAAFQINGAYSGADFLEIQNYNSLGNFLGSVALKNGSFGIGTTSPNEKLHVAGNIHAYDTSADRALFASTAAGSTTIAIRSNGITHFNGGNVGIGTTSPNAKLQVNSGAIGMSNTTGVPLNARLVKTGSTSVTFTIKVGAIGAWRAGHAFIKVSGAQNGLQEHHSAWYHIKLVHYYLSDVVNSGTSNPSCIRDSGGDTISYTVSVTATNNADPQVITITISDVNSSTNSMVADIDCSFLEGIYDLY